MLILDRSNSCHIHLLTPTERGFLAQISIIPALLEIILFPTIQMLQKVIFVVKRSLLLFMWGFFHAE